MNEPTGFYLLTVLGHLLVQDGPLFPPQAVDKPLLFSRRVDMFYVCLFPYVIISDSFLQCPLFCACRYSTRFEITEVRRGCEVHQGSSGWTKTLRVGSTVCVECQPFAMKRKLGVRCKGHGVFHRETRWTAIMASGCRGKWRMTEKKQDGGCESDTEVSFILV